MILVSKCLIGENCKYNGGNNYHEQLVEFLKDKEYIAVCPEVLGGLQTPRTCCEIVDGKVIDQNGEDKTQEYTTGAHLTLQLALENKCELAILQVRSPSCGKGQIYDGTFSRRLINGNGISADLLMKHGINVLSSDEFSELYLKNK